jgi:hypothetical protein
MKKLTILFLLIFTFTKAYSQTWYPLGSGTDNRVEALTENGADLIAGGDFLIAGGVNVNKIGQWYASSWSPMERGIDSTGSNQEVVYALTAGEPPFDHLIAGGHFTSVGGDTSIHSIAQWSGSTWTPLGYGIDGGVYAVIYYNSILYAGGSCSVRSGVGITNIMQWNGSSWDSLPGNYDMDGWVNALTIFNGNLIVAGSFTHRGGVTVNYIAEWNGSYWQQLGSGMDNSVLSLTVWQGKLIAGGYFTHAGGVSANYIAQWDGSTFAWSPLGSGLAYSPYALTVFHNNLIAGTNEYSGPHLYKWGGISWSPMAGGTNGGVYSLFGSDFALYVGGQFTTAGGVNTHNIAKLIESGNVVKHRNALNKPIPSHEIEIDSLFLYYSFGGGDDNSGLYITDVKITIDTVTYPIDSDLEFYLIHQSVTDTIIYQAGGSGANFRGTILNDSASTLISNGAAPFTGSFKPSKPLSQFNGLDPGGAWILKVYDRGTGNTGTLEAWSLDITYGVNPIGIKPISSEVPKSFKLMQNYPNPFNPSTKINFALPKDAFAKIIIYDVLGREVAKIVNENLKRGTYAVDWDASNFSSGVYFYRLETDGYIETKKMVLLK